MSAVTRLPHIGAMQFYGGTFATSYGFASRFAGEHGHVATLPELVSARAALPLDHLLWNNYHATSSSEYFGTSRGGNDIVIVAHGNGPLNNLEAIERAYAPERLPRTRQQDNGEGFISRAEFRRLENGDYGDVTIIGFAQVRRAYTEEYTDYLSVYAAADDPLLLARMGANWRPMLEAMVAETRRTVNRPGQLRLTVKNDMPFRYWHPQYRPELPYGHLLTIGRTANNHLSHPLGPQEFVGLEVNTLQGSDGKRFVGLRPGGDAGRTHEGPELLGYHPEALLLPHTLDIDAPQPTLYRVSERNGRWYTQVPKEGYAMDTGRMQFPATPPVLIGNPGRLVSDELFFLKYDLATVQQQAPPGANAYYLGEHVTQPTANGRQTTADIYFCKVEVDTTQRCASADELEGNFDLQLELLERYEAGCSA